MNIDKISEKGMHFWYFFFPKMETKRAERKLEEEKVLSVKATGMRNSRGINKDYREEREVREEHLGEEVSKSEGVGYKRKREFKEEGEQIDIYI